MDGGTVQIGTADIHGYETSFGRCVYLTVQTMDGVKHRVHPDSWQVFRNYLKTNTNE